jgi:glycosyltransferase involved in cell wall biosynthesis
MKKKIVIILPFIGVTGGIRVLIEYANRLYEKGYDVTLAFPLIGFPFGLSLIDKLKSIVTGFVLSLEYQIRLRPPIFKNKVPVVFYSPFANFSKYNCAIACAWPTALYLKKFKERGDHALYVVHHVESDSGPLEKIIRTYSYGIPIITCSKRTAQQIEKYSKGNVKKIIHYPIDHNMFWPQEKNRDEINVLFYLCPGRRKGMDIGLHVIKELKKYQLTHVNIFAFGPHPIKSIPVSVKYYDFPSDIELSQLYGKAHIFVYTSKYEGYGLPPLEAMACGCAVISTDVGAVGEYADSESIILCDVEQAKERIPLEVMELIRNPQKIKALGINGIAAANKLKWEDHILEIESFLN